MMDNVDRDAVVDNVTIRECLIRFTEETFWGIHIGRLRKLLTMSAESGELCFVVDDVGVESSCDSSPPKLQAP
jgi:hypothetical protein